MCLCCSSFCDQLRVCRLWYYYLDPLSYTVYGLVASQLGDVSTPIDVPGKGTMSVESYLIITYRTPSHLHPAKACTHAEVLCTGRS